MELSRAVLHIGMDDIDSWLGGCTTHFAYEVLRELIARFNVKLLDYPALIRLNPNVPWKTRGNGAVCLRVEVKSNIIDEVVRFLGLKLRSYTSNFHDSDPVIALIEGNVDKALIDFYRKALMEVVTLKEAIDLAHKVGAIVIKPRSGMGLIGSLAAIGSLTLNDYTFEILAYRHVNQPRRLDHYSVWTMEFETWPYTFNNVDYEDGRVLITPHGPDPVFYGIRGEESDVVIKAAQLIRTYEEPLGKMVFRTNQGTDCHYMKIDSLEKVKLYMSIAFRGEVASKPIVIKGGHVIFKVSRGAHEIWCAAYKPSGDIRRVAEKLNIGDEVEVYGGVKGLPGSDIASLNLEKIVVVRAQKKIVEKNPPCPNCHRTLKSSGRYGMKCEFCGFKMLKKEKVQIEVHRDDIEGMYLPPPRSMRHLAKPFRRYGMEKKEYMFRENAVDLSKVMIL